MHLRESNRAAGYIEFSQAKVRWFLSIDQQDLPKTILEKGQRTYRSITLDGDEIEFSDGFTELHTQSYQKILNGKGFGLEDARSSIQLVHDIRNATITAQSSKIHPFLR